MVIPCPGGARWFKLLLIALLLIGVVAMLVKLTWSKVVAPPPIMPKTGADTAPYPHPLSAR
jgi:hypothetical protein